MFYWPTVERCITLTGHTLGPGGELESLCPVVLYHLSNRGICLERDFMLQVYNPLSSYILIRLLLAECQQTVRPGPDVDVEDPALVVDGESEGTVGTAVLTAPDQEPSVGVH